jgi:stage II sporulation protein AB (anti-sigma F factor)
MRLELESLPSNESFARVVVAAFLTRLNPTMEEVADIKTAISEAVTNAIIHGYQNEVHKIIIEAAVEGDMFEVSVQDFGKGIEDIEKAMEPLYTTRRDLERSGMGFVFMEAFMDSIHVTSELGEGTKVTMKKKIGRRYEKQD